MKALVGAFNQGKALVGAFSVIVQLHRLIDLQHYLTAMQVARDLSSAYGKPRDEPSSKPGNMVSTKFHEIIHKG